jgi:molybdenum cofactor cytidylyltransferase
MGVSRSRSKKLDLSKALRLDLNPQPRLAFVGSGGKTTALFNLARLLPPPVLTAASAHLALDQLMLADRHFVVRAPDDLPQASDLDEGILLFTGPPQGDRVMGLQTEVLERLRALSDQAGLSLLIEADGSRRLPLKAPAPHEPPVPDFVNIVVVVAGLSGLGKPLNEQYVYRPEIFSDLAGLELGAQVSVEHLGRVLSSPGGGLKNIPPGARRVALLNQAGTPELRQQGLALASLLRPHYHSVIVASISVHPDRQTQNGTNEIHYVIEPAAGIVLAAGGAHRYGAPKQLLMWQGEPLVRRSARMALKAGLSPVVVVLGAHSEEVQAAVADLKVDLVCNPNWESGQSSSLQAGLQVLPAETGSAMFLLVDQPHITAALLQGLVERHAQTLAPAAAPRVAGRRANPILFDRSMFAELMAIRGDIGGRVIFEALDPDSIAWLTWEDPDLLFDIDAPEDYPDQSGI